MSVCLAVDVHTARVRAPAARPAIKPETASSMTRPAIYILLLVQAEDNLMNEHCFGSAVHSAAPARYGAGLGFPSDTSFAVMTPKAGLGRPAFSRILGVFFLDAIILSNQLK